MLKIHLYSEQTNRIPIKCFQDLTDIPSMEDVPQSSGIKVSVFLSFEVSGIPGLESWH